MLKKVAGVAETIPVRAQRAASEGPRWTRAVGSISATPFSKGSLAAALPGTRRVSARQGWAGEKAGLFEHPAKVFSPCSRQTVHQSVTMSKWFSRDLSDRLRLTR